MQRNIGLWSANYNTIHGQAIVTGRVAKLVGPWNVKEYLYNDKGLRMVASWVSSSVRLWKDACLGNVSIVYVVCSRSRLGFLRDLPAYLTGMLGVRIIVHLHGSDIIDLIHIPFLGNIALFIMRRSEIIVPSTHLFDPLTKAKITNFYLCENFSNALDFYSRTEPSFGSKFIVLWNSNVIASKGFLDVVASVQSVVEEGLDVTMTVIGRVIGDNEVDAHEMHAHLNEISRFPWFTYMGIVESAQAVALCGSADLICLPSTYPSECQPLAIIDAMCLGRNIIVSDTPAMKATVGKYPADFVKRGDVAGLSLQIKKLYHHKLKPNDQDHANMNSEAVKARIRFSVERFERQITEIFIAE